MIGKSIVVCQKQRGNLYAANYKLGSSIPSSKMRTNGKREDGGNGQAKDGKQVDQGTRQD
jgi:hypothetical protein